MVYTNDQCSGLKMSTLMSRLHGQDWPGSWTFNFKLQLHFNSRLTQLAGISFKLTTPGN